MPTGHPSAAASVAATAPRPHACPARPHPTRRATTRGRRAPITHELMHPFKRRCHHARPATTCRSARPRRCVAPFLFDPSLYNAAVLEPIDPSPHPSPPRALTLHHDPHLRPHLHPHALPFLRIPRLHPSPSSSSSPITPQHLQPHLPHPQVRHHPPASARAQRPSLLDRARSGTPRPTICTSWGRASRFLASPRASPLGPQCRGGDPGSAERRQVAARGGGAGGGRAAGGGAGGTSWNADPMMECGSAHTG